MPGPDGYLPLGRYSCSWDTLEDQLGGQPGSVRRSLFDDLEQLVELTQEVLGRLPALWIGGSFVSTKTEPDDLDVVFVLEHRGDLEDDQLRFVRQLVDDKLGLSVSTRMLQWRPSTGHGASYPEYLEWRGYWDDLWSRRKVGGRAGAVPSRGYLEVIIDGYE